MPNAGLSTEKAEMTPEKPAKQPAEEGQPHPELISPSPFLNEEFSSETISPLPDDYKAYQELLKRVTLDLDIQVEEVRKPSPCLFDILSTAVPSQVALQCLSL